MKKQKKEKSEKSEDQIQLSQINPIIESKTTITQTFNKQATYSPKVNSSLAQKGITVQKLQDVFMKYANDDQLLHLEDLYNTTTQLEIKITNTIKKEMEQEITELAQNNYLNFNQYCYLLKKFDTLVTKQIKEWRQAFKLFDKDGSNSITSVELEKVMKGLGLNVTKTQLDDMIKQIDENGDGTINFEEFCLLMESDLNNQETELEIEEIFRILDRNGDGYFTKDELIYVMKQLNEDISETLADQMIKDADNNKDNKIDLNDFKEIMRLAK